MKKNCIWCYAFGECKKHSKIPPENIEEYLHLKRKKGMLLSPKLFTDVCKRIKKLEKKVKK